MKISRTKDLWHGSPGKRKQNEDGFVATMTFITLLAIMVILATAGDMALIHLHREVKVLERDQIKRLNASQTNSVAIVRIDMASANSK